MFWSGNHGFLVQTIKQPLFDWHLVLYTRCVDVVHQTDHVVVQNTVPGNNTQYKSFEIKD